VHCCDLFERITAFLDELSTEVDGIVESHANTMRSRDGRPGNVTRRGRTSAWRSVFAVTDGLWSSTPVLSTVDDLHTAVGQLADRADRRRLA
jgi:hypothetical protein